MGATAGCEEAATARQDFTGSVSQTLSFPAGSRARQLKYTIVGDVTPEAIERIAESIRVTLTLKPHTGITARAKDCMDVMKRISSPYFKIAIAGTDRTLAATADGELVVVPAFSGAPEQLWRLDQLADGSWRIMPKSVFGSRGPLSLSAVGSSFATLSKFDPASEKQRWILKIP